MKLGILLVLIISVFFTVYLSVDEDKHVNDLNDPLTTQTVQTKETAVKKNIEILYLDKENVDKNTNEKVNNINIRKEKNDKEHFIYKNKEQTLEYIKKNKLINISYNPNKSQSEQSRFQIYSPVSLKASKKNKDKMIPPSAPSFVSFKSSRGTDETVLIDSDLLNYVKKTKGKLFVTETYGENIIDGVELSPNKEDTQDEDNIKEDVLFTAPPTIGVNE